MKVTEGGKQSTRNPWIISASVGLSGKPTAAPLGAGSSRFCLKPSSSLGKIRLANHGEDCSKGRTETNSDLTPTNSSTAGSATPALAANDGPMLLPGVLPHLLG